MQLQQGDVLIEAVKNIPSDVKSVKKEERGYVLARGEATGHAHVIEADIDLYEKDGILYIKNSQQVDIKHEEHAAITLIPGIWKVGIVKEYDPFLEETRNIRD